MSQDKGNDMRLEDSSQDKGTVTSPKATIEDKLNQVLAKMNQCIEDGEGVDYDYYGNSHVAETKFTLADMKAELQAIITTETTNTLLKLKKEMEMHTVPEGKELITRSYLNNSIDFMVAQLNTPLTGEHGE